MAYYTKGHDHYIIFPWATRGNLRDFWEADPPKLDQSFLRWVFTQMLGLADAVKTLHRKDNDQNMRHGDLKPENILCFDDLKQRDAKDVQACILVIADVGLSRSHGELTEQRNDPTSTKSGTIMFEPPETELRPKDPRSRRYDVWSLGCIYLEFMIWLLYGQAELRHFEDDIKTSGSNKKFYAIGESQVARLHPEVQKWVDWMMKDPRFAKATAIRNLLDLVVEKLLLADVSRPQADPGKGTPTFNGTENAPHSLSVHIRTATFDSVSSNSDSAHPCRVTAEVMHHELNKIFANATSDSKWIDWSATTPGGPRRYGNYLAASTAVDPREQQVRER